MEEVFQNSMKAELLKFKDKSSRDFQRSKLYDAEEYYDNLQNISTLKWSTVCRAFTHITTCPWFIDKFKGITFSDVRLSIQPGAKYADATYDHIRLISEFQKTYILLHEISHVILFKYGLYDADRYAYHGRAFTHVYNILTKKFLTNTQYKLLWLSMKRSMVQ